MQSEVQKIPPAPRRLRIRPLLGHDKVKQEVVKNMDGRMVVALDPAPADAPAETAADTRVYAVRGELFFASSNDLVYQFDYVGDPANIVIDMSDAHIWDASTVATLDAITTKYAAKGKSVTIIGMNDNSAERHARLSGQLSGAH